MASEEDFARLLRSIVEVARAIFGAQGSSIFLLDEDSDELVFAAVAGEQEQFLVGSVSRRRTGIAGWVASTRTPLVHRGRAERPSLRTRHRRADGYVPKGIMAVPLLDDERVLGVLQVLDRPQTPDSPFRRWSC